MANDAQEKKLSTPYISWKTFTSFIGNIRGQVPAQIDPSVLRTMSGTARSQLTSALRFLDLVETDATTKDSLRKLADSYNTDQWKPQLQDLIAHAYQRVVNDLKLESATPAMLRERFRSNGGVEGGTIDSAVRFYLSALKEAEIPFSSHLVLRQRAPRGAGTRQRSVASKPAQRKEADDGAGFEPQEGTFQIPFAVLGLDGSVFLPEDVSKEQWAAISQYVDMVIGLRLKAQANA